MENPTSVNRLYVGKVMSIMAVRVSTELSSFAGWMITGFAVLLGLMLTNIESVSKYVPTSSFGYSILLFLAAAVLHVIQRYLSSIVAASAEVGKEIELLPINGEIDIGYVLEHLETSTLWPTRALVKWSNSKICSGDLAFGGRVSAYMAQIQAWLV